MMLRFHRRFVLTFCLFLSLGLFISCEAPHQAAPKAAAGVEPSKPKYIFLFIGDGMGRVQRRFGELAAGEKLLMNGLPVQCPTATHSANRKITDSAASGTALARGVKTNNGVLGQTPDGAVFSSVAQKARAVGMRVGVLTSVPLNDATPAAFYAHVESRGMFDDITAQLPQSGFDFFAAGGFMVDKKSHEDVVKEWKKEGYKVVQGEAELEKITPGEKTVFLNQFAGQSIPYWVDVLRSPEKGTLSLARMVAAAISQLDSPAGFFMMVEGGQIDDAGHAHLAAAMAYDVVALNDAVKVAYAFYKKHPHDTLIVVTADHETGGIKLDESKVDMAALKRIHAAAAGLKKKNAELKKEGADVAAVQKAGEERLGIKLTDEEKADLKKCWARKLARDPQREFVSRHLLNCAQSRVGVLFTTGGHTGVDVLTTAVGCGANAFRKANDNTDIAKLLTQMLPAAQGENKRVKHQTFGAFQPFNALAGCAPAK